MLAAGYLDIDYVQLATARFNQFILLSARSVVNPPPAIKFAILAGRFHPSFTMLRALAIYSGTIAKINSWLKFKHNIGISEVFALKLSRLVVSLEWKPDLVVAVPLNRIHLHARSYNQAELLARPLSWLIQVPYIPDAVERVKPTQSQVGLNAEQRKMNVHKAFFSRSELVNNKTILLVDDVCHYLFNT